MFAISPFLPAITGSINTSLFCVISSHVDSPMDAGQVVVVMVNACRRDKLALPHKRSRIPDTRTLRSLLVLLRAL